MNILRFIYIIFISFSISGCLAPSTQGNYSKKEYEIIQKKLAFLENTQHILNHTIDKKSFVNFINLPTLNQSIVFTIPVEKKLQQIYFIELSQKSKLNINRILIENQDYFFDSVHNEILLVFTLPYVYFFDNQVRFLINIRGKQSNKPYFKKIFFDFKYTPMKKAKSYNEKNDNPSYKYTSFDNEDLSLEIKEKLKKEFNMLDINRLDFKYKNKAIKIKKMVTR